MLANDNLKICDFFLPGHRYQGEVIRDGTLLGKDSDGDNKKKLLRARNSEHDG